MSKEFELVSISKQKLENLKSQVRAVQIRTHLTQIVDGMPYFRGRPLPRLDAAGVDTADDLRGHHQGG